MQAPTIKLLTTNRADALRVALVAAQRAQRIGARMRERRQELELTQVQVASRMGIISVTKDYIWRWENGRVEPSSDYLEKGQETRKLTLRKPCDCSQAEPTDVREMT